MRAYKLQLFLLVLLSIIGLTAAVLRFSSPTPPKPKKLTQATSEVKKVASRETGTIQQTVLQAATSTFDVEKFKSYGFPAPEEPNPAAMKSEALDGWNKYLRNHVSTASQATGVDPGIIGMWPYVETQGSWTPFDNCDQEHNVSSAGDGDPNTQCYLWGDYWQVGPGNHLAYTHSFLPEAFDAMYGSQDNATVQKVGQSVIDNHPQRFGKPLTIVSSFPNVSLTSIIDGAKSGDYKSRNLMATLMKDDAIGVYLIARHFKDNIGINSGLAAKMSGWSSSYYGAQKIVNHIKAIHDAGVSGGTSPGGGGGGTFSNIPALKLVVRPNTPDTYVQNQAVAQVIGAGTDGGGGGGGAPPGTVDGHCTPTGSYPSDPAGELKSKYNIYLSGHGEKGTKMIYETVTCLANSRFPALLKPAGTVTIYNHDSPRMSCPGDGSCYIWMPDNLNAFKFILSHEIGHVLYYSNTRELMKVAEFENAWAKEGGLSPYSGPYYGGQGGCPTKGMAEDYAELVAYYYNPTQGGKTGACDSRDNPKNSLFQDDHFPLHLEVAKQVL